MQKLVRFYIRFFLHSSVFVRLVAFGLSGRSFSLIHLFFGQLVSMCRQREIIIIIALLRMYQRASEHSSSAIPRNRLQAPRKHGKSGLVCWRYLSSFVFRSPGRQESECCWAFCCLRVHCCNMGWYRHNKIPCRDRQPFLHHARL